MRGHFGQRADLIANDVGQRIPDFPVGGPGHALMAFRQSDGAVLWSKGDMDNAYSSPILIRTRKRDQIVSFMAKEVMVADAATGELLWTVGHRTMYDTNAATRHGVKMPRSWGPGSLLRL